MHVRRALPTARRLSAAALTGLLTVAVTVSTGAPAHAEDRVSSGFVDSSGTAFKVVPFDVTGSGTITLSLDWATPSANLNLFLKNPSGVQVASATSTTNRPEIITVPATEPGLWKVTVKAASGASSYDLAMSYPTASTLPSYARTIGGPGHAQIYPSGLDVDPAGVLYVADTGNDQIVAFNADGTERWRVGPRSSTLKALGRFSNPRDVAYLNGRVYVADLANNRVQVLDAATGQALSAWSYRFTSIIGISAGVDGAGNPVILTTDDALQSVLRFQPDGSNPVQIGSGSSSCNASNPCPDGVYNAPRDAATDSAGNVYIADYTNDRMQKFSAAGAFIVAWGTKGTGDLQFGRPYGVDVDAAGRVYVADSNNARIQVFTVNGTSVTYVKTYGTPPGGQNQLTTGHRRVAVGSGADPLVYGADLWGSRIPRFTYAGALSRIYGGPLAPDGGFNEPGGVAVDGTAAFVMDTNNQRVQRFSPSGAFELKWGERGFGESNSGFNWARDLTISAATGTVWVADTKNSRLQEFQRDGAATGRTMGQMSYAPGPGLLYWPHAVAASGENVVVANTKHNRVELWDPRLTSTSPTGKPIPGGQVWTSTGSPGVDFKSPKDVTVSNGVVYVADADNHRIVKLSLSDGSFLGAISGAAVHRVEGVAVAPNGTIWVADTSYNRLLQLSSGGALLQVVGAGSGGAGDPAHGKFNSPTHLEITSDGSSVELYVVDSYNDRIEIFDITGSSS